MKISVGELHAMAEGAAEWGWLSGYVDVGLAGRGGRQTSVGVARGVADYERADDAGGLSCQVCKRELRPRLAIA